MDSPVVSVIVPCYNHERFVEQCILSIVNQTYKNIELIVLDDGSKDKSPQILSQLQEKYGFILECQDNMGLSRTLNKAIAKYVTGKYVCCLASDDYWEVDKIEKQVAYLEQHPEVAVVYAKAYLIDNDGNRLPMEKDYYPERVSNVITFNELLVQNQITALTTLIRYSVLTEMNGYNEDTPIEDWDLWLRISYKYPIHYMNIFVGFYREHATNASKNMLKMLNAANTILESWKDKADKTVYKRAYQNFSMHAFRLLSRDHKKEALKYLSFSPSNWFDSRFYKGLVKLAFY